MYRKKTGYNCYYGDNTDYIIFSLTFLIKVIIITRFVTNVTKYTRTLLLINIKYLMFSQFKLKLLTGI